MTDAAGGTPRPPGGSRTEAEISAYVRTLVHRLRAGEVPQPGEAGPREIDSLPDTPERLRVQDHKQDIGLKKTYAYWLLGAVVVQLFAADAVFVTYAWVGKGWNLDAVVINVWLGATLVQAVGVVAIVTRYLFPRRDAVGTPSG